MSARHIAVFAACLPWLLTPGAARGADKAACIEAHEHGQEIRLANRWVEARRLFLTCAQAGCPPPVVQDCTRWEDELSLHLPSVVVSAKRADGSDVDDVAVFVDGARLGDRLPVVPIPLDPGEHTLRFEHAGIRAVERRVVLHDGEHARVEVNVEAAALQGTQSQPPLPQGSSPPVAGYVFTGMGVAATITSVVFLVMGKVSEHDLAASSCGQAGTCANAQVDPIRTDYIVSGIAAGVAAVAVGIALWQFVAHGSRPPSNLAWAAGHVEF